MCDISEPFKIKTGVRQGDGLSPLLLNSVLEKVIREWEEGISDEEAFRIRRGKMSIQIDCLIFADDIVIVTNNVVTAKIREEELQAVAREIGLQVPYEKIVFMTNIKEAPLTSELKENRIEKSKE